MYAHAPNTSCPRINAIKLEDLLLLGLPSSRRAMDGTIMKEILRHCNDNSDRPVYSWIGDKCEVERSVTYRELSERTQEIAEGLLQSLQIRRGERVILCYPPGLDFILSLIACLRAGFTAGEHTCNASYTVLCRVLNYIESPGPIAEDFH